MGRVPNVRCPVCQENGHDNGGDSGHLFLMAKGDRWCCPKSEYHPDNKNVYFPNNKATNEPVFDEQIQESRESSVMGQILAKGYRNGSVRTVDELADVNESERLFADYRGVPARVWEEYRTHLVLDNDTGDPYKHIYEVFKNGKKRGEKTKYVEDKDFEFSKRCPKKVEPYGWHTLEGKIPKRLLVTEGEIDAASAKFMLEKYNVKAISGSHGDNSIKQLAEYQDAILKVPDLTFCGDQDPVGIEYTEKVVSLFPDIKVMKLPLKDANDMLTQHREAEFIDAYFRADTYRPPSIVLIEDIKESLRDFLPMGQSYPWDGLTKITYGSVDHQIISIGAGPGAGKTTFVRGIQAHQMFEHNEPLGIYSLETNAKITLRQLVGYMMNQKIDLPGARYDVDEAVAQAEKLIGLAYIYDKRYFNNKWENILKNFRYLYAAYGVKKFYVDPITSLTILGDSSEQNTLLGKIMNDLSDLIQELPLSVMIVNHLNNPRTGKAHDEGGRVLPSQFTGSKAQWRFSTDMWGLERDILNEDETIKHRLDVVNLKHRTDGSLTGRRAPLIYKPASGRLYDKTNRFLEGDDKAKKAKEHIEQKFEEKLKQTTSIFGREVAA